MSKNLNVSDFNLFILNHGQVSCSKAAYYSRLGHEIIKLAMKSPNPQAFEEEMEQLKSEYIHVITDGPHSISNMASCLLYAQTEDNFLHRQGYGKGSNINQYGDAATSRRAVANLMVYFSTERTNKEYGYDGESTHGKWRAKGQKLPEEIPDMKLRIDIDANAKTGSIPAPLKGIHTAHLVPGVDSNGVVKLLIKPENWGMKKLLHIIFHSIDYLLTRIFDSKVEGLESRQETKMLKEYHVSTAHDELNQLANEIAKLSDTELKKLFKEINKELAVMTKMKGFDEPIAQLNNIAVKLEDWINNNPSHPQINELSAYASSVQAYVDRLNSTKSAKYGAPEQQFSEVRLHYKEDGSAAVFNQKFNEFKRSYTDQSHQPSSPSLVIEESIPPTSSLK